MLKLGTVICNQVHFVMSEWLIQDIDFVTNPIEIFVLIENLAFGSQDRYIMYRYIYDKCVNERIFCTHQP